MRLSPATLGRLAPHVARFGYDRDAQALGIVHFGIGAFHRAHQAWYTDLAMDAGDRDWAISGVCMRSPGVAEQLVPQAGLYTVTERSGDDWQTRLVGSVREVLFAHRDGAAIIDRIASEDCRIVSLTVTEKGYCRNAAGGLEIDHAQTGFYPLLAEALERRAAKGMPGLTLLSCDNLSANGAVLGALMRDWLVVRSPSLLDWFGSQCSTPSTMIDRIVPASTADEIDQLEQRIGVRDEGAVFTERFSQWVVEGRFAQGRPRWDRHGAQVVENVAPYETAKLRMLNGAHSLLAYCGLQKGYSFVHEAVADGELLALATDLMCQEAMPSVEAAPGQDLSGYADALLRRFADPALRHRLAQIAMDGSQKIPQRWLDTVAWNSAQGRDTPAIRRAFDAWCWHLLDGRFVDDPHADSLRAVALEGGKSAVLNRVFGDGRTPGIWFEHREVRASLCRRGRSPMIRN